MSKKRITIPAPSVAPSPAPPPPKPVKPPAPDVLELFENNLADMRAYYREIPGDGPERGIYVAIEIALNDTMTALQLARQGKKWTRPAR